MLTNNPVCHRYAHQYWSEVQKFCPINKIWVFFSWKKVIIHPIERNEEKVLFPSVLVKWIRIWGWQILKFNRKIKPKQNKMKKIKKKKLLRKMCVTYLYHWLIQFFVQVVVVVVMKMLVVVVVLWRDFVKKNNRFLVHGENCVTISWCRSAK